MKSESKAFWIFLVWVLLLPFLDQISLKAENAKAITSKPQEVSPMQDFEVSDDAEKNLEANQEPDQNETTSEIEEKEEEEEEEQLPALSADPMELLGKVNGLAKAKKYKSVIKQLSAHEDVIVTDGELLNIYVEALINAEKPNWRSISRFAKLLGNKKRKSSLANYAQGLYYLNKKKPDLSKALKFIEKAKNAKKPFPGAGTQYYIVILKKYWQILLLVLVIPIFVVGKIMKKKKAPANTDTEISIDISTDTDATNNIEVPIADVKNILEKVDENTVPLANKLAKSIDEPKTNDEDKNNNISKTIGKDADRQIPKKIETKPEVDINETSEIDVPKDIPSASSNIEKTIVNPGHEEPVVASTIYSAPKQTPTPTPTPMPMPIQPIQAQPVANVREEASNPEATIAQPIQNEHLQQGRPSLNSNLPNTFPNQQFANKLTETIRQEPVADTSELDATWNRLCQKALQKRIPQDFSKNRKTPNDYGNSKLATPSMPPIIDSQVEPEIDLNVTIDLSEESLREDLIGKLKMLAISDSELRALFSQKKPAHIPHLIEYVLTRPEPLRLSFLARELGHYVDPAVIDTLASLLYHEDNRVILGAIQGLENTKSAGAILHICPFLKSETPVLAQAARNALSNFGAVKILKAFINLPSHSDEKIKEAGIFVLSRMKGKQVEDLLVSMLDDEAIEIRKTVLLAMAYQKNPVYIEPLRNFFRIAKDDDKMLSRKAIVYLQGFVTKQSHKESLD